MYMAGSIAEFVVQHARGKTREFLPKYARILVVVVCSQYFSLSRVNIVFFFSSLFYFLMRKSGSRMCDKISIAVASIIVTDYVVMATRYSHYL